MNSTSGPWTYNPDFREVQHLDRIIAKVVEGQEGAPQEELHANGYIMAAAPHLHDELANLSRAVASYLDHAPDEGGEGMLKEQYLLDDMEVMLERAEHALGHIFPAKGTS